VIELPEHEWARLVPGGGPCLMTVASDTEERYVKVTPLPADREHLLLEVPHQDRPGQVARFTALLRSHFPDTNVVSSYLRLREAGGLAVWRCLLETAPGRHPDLRRAVRTAFAAEKDRGDPGLRVTFPEPLAEDGEPAWPSRAGLWQWLWGFI
jgi:hypothetical protein